jgi:ketosteroid isomerase-like protein
MPGRVIQLIVVSQNKRRRNAFRAPIMDRECPLTGGCGGVAGQHSVWFCRQVRDAMSDVLDQLFTALNAHDLEAAAALFHEDYRSEQPAHPGRAFVGRAQMHANWEAMFAGIPNFRSEVMRTVDDGNTTWVEWKWTGTRSDGQPFQVRGVALFEVEGGLITAGRLYLEDVERDWIDIEQAVQSLSGRRPRTGPG